MAETEALKNMVLSFRVSELQMLLGFAGRNKSGRKTELQARAVELLRLRSTPVQMKIKDLYKTIQQGHASGTMAMQQGASSSKDITSVHSTMQSQQQPQQPQPQQTPQQSPRTVYQAGYQATDRPLPPLRPSLYLSNSYHHAQYQAKASPPAPANSYPVHPDVKLKKLPFFDLLGELLKPSSLVPQGNHRLQEGNFVFHLTPQQATDIATSRDIRPGSKMDYVIQVQMRFCLLETSCEQDDFFPPGVCVKVNGKMCPLPNPIPTNKPGVEPKRPPRPVHITPMVRLSPTVANHITVSWNAEYGRGYTISVYLVRKLTSAELLQRLKNKGSRHSDYTRGLIKEKLQEDADCEIATTSLRVSLVCPLGKMRMTTPCRASTCYHLQCFDASLYLQMNERKPTWMCPVCDKPAAYDNLVIDGYFQQVLASTKLPLDGNEIQLHQDGSWSSLCTKKEQTQVVSPMPEKSVAKVETEDLVAARVINEGLTWKKKRIIAAMSLNQVVIPEAKTSTSETKQKEVIDLTLSDSEEEAGDKNPGPSKVDEKPDSSTQSVPRRPLDSTSVSSTGSSGGSVCTAGPSSVTSSGYMSPSIITLDSPSPPVTPTPTSTPLNLEAPIPAPLRMPPPSFPSSMFLSNMTSFLDLDSDSNSPQPGSASTMYSRF